MSNKHNSTVLNYIDHLLIVISTVTGCVSTSTFVSLVGIPIRTTSTSIELKICAKTAGIKRYKSIIYEKKKKHDEKVLLAKSTLNSIIVFTIRFYLIQILVMMNSF